MQTFITFNVSFDVCEPVLDNYNYLSTLRVAKSSDEPAETHSLARAFAARTLKVGLELKA